MNAAIIVKDFVFMSREVAVLIAEKQVNGNDIAACCRKCIETFPSVVQWPALSTAAERAAATEAHNHLLEGVAKMAETIQAAHDQADAQRAVADNN